MKLALRALAPAFQLTDQAGKSHTLRDYRGRWVLLYFYPKDNTPGCTTEACSIRDVWAEFVKHSAVVLGISTDTAESHQKFATQHSLPFTLLADTGKKVVKAYGVWGVKKFMGRSYQGTKRISFLIDPRGRIAKIYEPVKPKEHAQQVLSDLTQLSKP